MLAIQFFILLVVVLIQISWTFSSNGWSHRLPLNQFHRRGESGKGRRGRGGVYYMALDEYVAQKLENIKRTFDALTERLSDPDVANDPKQVFSISKERSSIEETVQSYDEWKDLEKERLSLLEMEKTTSNEDIDLKDMIKNEIRDIILKQNEKEQKITLLLLPKDPNDDRNVMLEIRAGTGGDEASIFAGDLVSIYKKYAESQGWKVTDVSFSAGESGGYKTCVLQITGSFVYSKLKYEVSHPLFISSYL